MKPAYLFLKNKKKKKKINKNTSKQHKCYSGKFSNKFILRA